MIKEMSYLRNRKSRVSKWWDRVLALGLDKLSLLLSLFFTEGGITPYCRSLSAPGVIRYFDTSTCLGGTLHGPFASNADK